MSQNSPQGVKFAQQGHRYTYQGKDVIALNNGRIVKVLHFDPAKPWVGHTQTVPALLLLPQPMKYFHGEIPR